MCGVIASQNKSNSFSVKINALFVVIYTFKVKAEQKVKFRQNWNSLPHLIYHYEGSLGSRLHQEKDLPYLAYAQWPSKKDWEDAGKKRPPAADVFRRGLRDSCDEINTNHQLELIDDLLEEKAIHTKMILYPYKSKITTVMKA